MWTPAGPVIAAAKRRYSASHARLMNTQAGTGNAQSLDADAHNLTRTIPRIIFLISPQRKTRH
jgi:hypothetical protein